MKTYEIQKLHNPSYPYIVLSTSYINPLEEISSIEDSLKDSYKVRVIFDLLLSNGLSSDRFLEAEFDGSKFRYSSFKTIDLLDTPIKKQINSFYQSNLEYLDSSVLTNVHKFLIKQGQDF